MADTETPLAPFSVTVLPSMGYPDDTGTDNATVLLFPPPQPTKVTANTSAAKLFLKKFTSNLRLKKHESSFLMQG
ncbi:hypothetical protein [Limnohabitans sp.]|uniref:hypothetical protein n=1 Tax=Limnohabitans sp. TaxID=1907725 RepID=UPI0037C0EDAB